MSALLTGILTFLFADVDSSRLRKEHPRMMCGLPPAAVEGTHGYLAGSSGP